MGYVGTLPHTSFHDTPLFFHPRIVGKKVGDSGLELPRDVDDSAALQFQYDVEFDLVIVPYQPIDLIQLFCSPTTATFSKGRDKPSDSFDQTDYSWAGCEHDRPVHTYLGHKNDIWSVNLTMTDCKISA